MGNKPNKFDFVHQTVSRREARARGGHETRLGHSVISDTLCCYVNQTLVILLTAHIQYIPSVITTVAVSTGILKFLGAVELGRSRPKNCSIPSKFTPSFMIGTVIVVFLDPIGNLTGIAFALVIPVKSSPAAANEGKEKTRDIV